MRPQSHAPPSWRLQLQNAFGFGAKRMARLAEERRRRCARQINHVNARLSWGRRARWRNLFARTALVAKRARNQRPVSPAFRLTGWTGGCKQSRRRHQRQQSQRHQHHHLSLRHNRSARKVINLCGGVSRTLVARFGSGARDQSAAEAQTRRPTTRTVQRPRRRRD